MPYELPTEAPAVDAPDAHPGTAAVSSDELLHRGLAHVAELAVQALGACAAQIVWKEPDRTGAPLVAGTGAHGMAARHPLAGRVLQFGETVVEHAEAAAVALSASRWMLAVGVPLCTQDGRVQAALCLAYRRARIWDGCDQRLLDVLAADAATHLDQHAATAEVRTFYERTLNAMPAQLALFDLEARFTYVGRTAVRDPEVRDWLVGRTDLDYARRRGLDEMLALRRMAVIRRVARESRTIQFEETLKAGGRERHYIRFITPVLDEAGCTVQVLAYGLDITDRRRAELKLERFRTMLDHTSEAIFLIQAETGRFVDVNQGAERLLGYTREELLGLTAPNVEGGSTLGTPEAWRRHAEQVCAAEAPVSFESVYRRRDGTTFPAEVSLTGEMFEGRDYLLGLVRDVTERRQAKEALIAAKERAEEMSRLKSTFLTNMSHEIRTPLTGIIGFADVLTEEGDEHTREFAEVIHQSGRRLLDTLNAVLELARLEGDALELEPVPMDVRPLLRDAVARYREQTAERGLALDLDLPDDAVWALADADALGRVLDALLANAVKFTDEGGVTISAHSDAKTVVLTVADTGIGIDPTFVTHVFDEFRQQSSGDARAYEGSGLGLTLARRLLALMDGTIVVDSELGEGSTFSVRLPRAE